MTARVLVALPALLVLLAGSTSAVDDPALVTGLVGMAVCLLGATRSAAVIRQVAAVVGPGTPGIRDRRQAREHAAPARQTDPDAAGRTRARAPAGALPAA